jgi:recombination protein RecA
MEDKKKKAEENTKEGREAARKKAISQITKKYGQGSIMRLGDNTAMQVSAIPTGSLSLDFALGIGGVPKGRIIEIYGPESSGKTTLALHIAAEAQKLGGSAAFIDAEHALDPSYAQKIGVDIEDLLVAQPDDGEQALEIAEALISSDAIDVIIVDSVAALVPKAEIEGDMGQAMVGAHARLMSKALRKLSGAIARSQCVLIFINQLREKVGIAYGNPEVTTGGKALKFYASVRIDVRRGQQIKNKSDVVGNHTKCKVVKNKVAAPFKSAEFDIMYGEGISADGEIIDLGESLGIVQKSGSWYGYNGLRLGQGKDNAKIYLKENPDVREEIKSKILSEAQNIQGNLSFGGIAGLDEDDDDEMMDGFDE